MDAVTPVQPSTSAIPVIALTAHAMAEDRDKALAEVGRALGLHGLRVAAWYGWLFPNLMLNVYPWGLSVNVVEPLSPSRTEVELIGNADPGCQQMIMQFGQVVGTPPTVVGFGDKT